MKPPVIEVQVMMAVFSSFLLGVYHKTGLPIELLGGGMATAFTLGSVLLNLCEDKEKRLIQPLQYITLAVSVYGVHWCMDHITRIPMWYGATMVITCIVMCSWTLTEIVYGNDGHTSVTL
jgi:hypothetical protein